MRICGVAGVVRGKHRTDTTTADPGCTGDPLGAQAQRRLLSALDSDGVAPSIQSAGGAS